MDRNEYEKIIHAIPTTGIFIIREDNHEIYTTTNGKRKYLPASMWECPAMNWEIIPVSTARF